MTSMGRVFSCVVGREYLLWAVHSLGIQYNHVNQHMHSMEKYLHIIICVCVCSVMPDSLRPFGLQPARFFCLWDFSGKNTGVGSHFLFRGFFLTQWLNSHLLCLLHCRQILYCLIHQGCPVCHSINGYL